MNSLLRVALRLNSFRPILHNVVSRAPNSFQQRQLARNLWYMCNSRGQSDQKLSKLCTCGCANKQGVHSKGNLVAERELVEFLTEEILAERKAQKSKTLPAELDGFKVKLNGAQITLAKEIEGETITINFNVNHTIDTDVEAEAHPNMDKPELGELKSKPNFKVEISRGQTTLGLLCSFVDPSEDDIFGVDEITIYDGEWNENVYAVSGDVVDSYLYELILSYLEEKGISNEFVEKLSEYSTSYEHSAYIGLLEGLSKFASGK